MAKHMAGPQGGHYRLKQPQKRKKQNRIPARVLKSRARLLLSGAGCIAAVLIITALLAMPHQKAEPIEAAASPEAAPSTAAESISDKASVLDRAVQRRMADGMTYENAYEDARITIQAPGYSEHHTGLAVDFNDVEDDFRETEAYTWLQEHAAEYGFVERYPKGKESITGIDYEPWHYRYVGKEHAQRMNELNMCLEEYVAFLKGD